jgi:hypothetical protein
VREWLARPVAWGTWVASCLAIGMLFGLGLYLFEAIKTNRVRAIQELCEHDNSTVRHNIEFLRRLRVDDETMRLARDVFKVTPDCRAFAERTVKQKGTP